MSAERVGDEDLKRIEGALMYHSSEVLSMAKELIERRAAEKGAVAWTSQHHLDALQRAREQKVAGTGVMVSQPASIAPIPLYAAPPADGRDALVKYLNGFFESGNSVEVARGWLGADQWKIIKECVAEGLPLDHNVICGEVSYRNKLAAFGDETRAESPLAKLRAALASQGQQE